MKIPIAVHVLSLLLVLAQSVRAEEGASFAADLVDTRGGEARAGRLHYHDGNYRMELVERGQTLVVLVDNTKGTLRLLNPAEHSYYEGRASDPMSLFVNPFAFYAEYARVKGVRGEGIEAVGGIPCRKQVVAAGEQLFATGWVADGFALPLKVEVPLSARTIELRNLRPGPQDPNLFTVPAGYQLQVREVESARQPEWAGQVAGAPLLVPPFERTLATGGIVRVRPQAGRWLSIAGTNPGPGLAEFTAASFKDGKYIGGGSMSTVGVDAGDSGAMSTGAQPDHTDEIVVRVGQGTMQIKTAFVPPSGRFAEAGSAPAEPSSAPAVPDGDPEPTATLTAPDTAGIATRLEIAWQGPGSHDDFIAIARPEQPPGAALERTSVREGNPLKIWAPSDAGTYEIRYVTARGTRLLARSALEVTGVPAAVEPHGPVAAGAWIEVGWEGPARDADYISVAEPRQAPGASLGRTLTREGNPLKVRAPSDAGTLEVRYVLGRGNRMLAKAPVTITAVTAEISAPATAVAGADFEVAWQGPGYPEDFVSVARTEQAAGASLHAGSVRKGNPLKLRAPKEPGRYEVRYVLGRGSRALVRKEITITAAPAIDANSPPRPPPTARGG